MSSWILFLVRAVAYPLSVVPYAWVLAIGDFLGILWFDVFRIRRVVACNNIHKAFPQLNDKECRDLARKSCKNMGRGLMDYFVLLNIKSNDFEKYFENEGLDKMKKYDNLGVLCVTLHLGSYDFATVGSALRGLRLSVISKQFKLKWVNDLWFGLRKQVGARFIREEGSTFEILKALKRREKVVFVLDQFMGPPTGVKVNFFGLPTGADQGLALLALRSHCPIVPIYNFRRDDGKIVLVVEDAMTLNETGDRREDIKRITQQLTDKIEEIIRRHPEQWMWIHRRWKEFRDDG